MAFQETDTGKGVFFVTMGCAKNEVDSAVMQERLVQAGYAVVDDPESADAVIVNTCSFIQAATEESIEAILEAAGLQGVKDGTCQLIVAGCMPARYRDELEGEFPEARMLVPCDEERSIVQLVDEACGVVRAPGAPAGAYDGMGAVNGASAYVKISDGCDRFCSYCTIPYIRGRYHSFAEEGIKAQVAECIGAGAREVVLIAQDTGRWGQDFEEPSTLAALMGRLAEEFPDAWFRVMYVQPEGVTDELISTVASHDNICSYFDIPFQHCNEKVLADMNRTGSADIFLDLIGRIREQVDGVTLRTTLIAGFPGETDEQFEELCDFVSEACLDYVGVFPYSREEGTRSYDLPGQIDEEEKLYRAQRLRDLADDVSSGVIQSRIGSEARVLVCGTEEDGQLYGRAMSQAPDVDGVTFIDGGQPGEVVQARIIDTLMYEMEAEVI